MPPPTRTAYFSRTRSPGVVLRVSRIFVFVPDTSSTQRFVEVAIPLIREMRLSAVRSARRMARKGPSVVAMIVPAFTSAPSSTFLLNEEMPQRNITASATSRPAITPGAFAMKFA